MFRTFFYHSMTTLKIGGFWIWTGSISWNLVVLLLILGGSEYNLTLHLLPSELIKNIPPSLRVEFVMITIDEDFFSSHGELASCWYVLLSGAVFIQVTVIDYSAENLVNCVTRAPLLYFIRSWVALSFKVCQWLSQSGSQSGIGNTCPDLHFVQYIRA